MTRLLLAALPLVMAACANNNSNTTAGADSTAHSDHHASTPASTDTGTGNQMVRMMHGMMEEMHAVKSAGHPDTDFAALMRAHHLAAVKMANLQAAAGSDTALRSMANRMVADQQREVAAFDAFLAKRKHGSDSAFYRQAVQDMAGMEMHGSAAGSLDRTFVAQMIPHHRGAVQMAQAYLQNGASDAGLKTIANEIIASQQKEITEMEAWLNRNR